MYTNSYRVLIQYVLCGDFTVEVIKSESYDSLVKNAVKFIKENEDHNPFVEKAEVFSFLDGTSDITWKVKSLIEQKLTEDK